MERNRWLLAAGGGSVGVVAGDGRWWRLVVMVVAIFNLAAFESSTNTNGPRSCSHTRGMFMAIWPYPYRLSEAYIVDKAKY